MHYFKSQQFRILLLIGFFLSCLTAVAQDAVPFAPRLPGGSMKVKGDVMFVGNHILNSSAFGNPPNAANNDANMQNNNQTMEYIDIDGDPLTWNSSSADLAWPATNTCYRVAYAGLYWASIYPYERSTTSNAQFTASVPRLNDWNQVKFKVPNGSYVDLSADDNADAVGEDDDIIFDGFGYYPGAGSALSRSFKDCPIICYKNVTSLLQNLPNANGTYTVANLRAAKGVREGGSSAGWVLVVIYENFAATTTSKFISIFDGYSGVKDQNSAPININGFTTLPPGYPVIARLGIAALEGDKTNSGDGLTIKANSLPGATAPTVLGTANNNPNNNFFNSTITNNNTQNIARNPPSTNTLGLDLDMFTITNTNNSVIPNNETGAQLRLSTSGDGYGAFLATFAVEIIEPRIVLTKTVEQGGVDKAGQPVGLGEALDYIISFQNVGNDNAQNFTIRDILPVNTTFESVVCPPGVTFNQATGVFTIANNLVEVGDGVSRIKLTVRLANSCNDLTDQCANVIENVAYATYRGILNPAQISDDPSVSSLACNAVPGPVNFLANVDNCTYQRTAILCGPSLDLTAGDGYLSYAWYRESGLPNNTADDVFLGSTQTITVNFPGKYYVINTPTPPCIGLTEHITVTLSSDLSADNPVSPYADETVECTNQGAKMANIFLCGLTDEREILSGATAGTVTWQKLDETACQAACPTCMTGPEDCPHNNPLCATSWQTVSTNPNFTVGTAGEYRIILNSNGCTATYYFNVYKNDLNPLVVRKDIICNVPGEIKITGMPASGYEYRLIDQSSGTVLVPYSATSVFPITVADTYKVEIQEVGVPHGCLFPLNDIVILNEDLIIDVTSTDKTCAAANPASIRIEVDGLQFVTPMQQFKYDLSGTATLTSGWINNDDPYTFDNLAPGTYLVTVSSSSGCLKTANVTITDYSNPVATAIVLQSVSCDPGTIQISATGGKAPYSFVAHTFNGTPITPVVSFSDGLYSVTAAQVGSYVFEVTDANGCKVLSNAIAIGNITPVVTTSSQNVKCATDTNGSITVTATGTGITYELLNAANTVIVPNSNTGNFTNLAPGNYTVNVIQTGVTTVCRYPYTFSITAPTALAVTGSITTQLSCLVNATITSAVATGGTAPYEYSINGTTFGSSRVFAGLAAGTYKVTVRDANGCTSQSANIVVNPAVQITNITFSGTPVVCTALTSNVTVGVTGGTGPFNYRITAPASAVVNNGTSAVFNGLAPGTYTFLVTGANGCTYSKDHTVVGITPINVTAEMKSNVICFGATNGSLTFDVGNFGTSYNYSITGVGAPINVTGATAAQVTRTGLAAGTYTVTVTNVATNCSDSDTVIIAGPTAALTASNSVTQPTCTTPTGSVTINSTGGWGGNEYSLTGAATVGPQNTPTFNGLAPGSYVGHVTDANGCTQVTNFIINPFVPVAITVAASSNLCYSAGGATITVAVTAGTGTSPIQFSKDGVVWQNSPTFPNLLPGTYTITARDSKNCTDTETVTIYQQLTASASLIKGFDCSGALTENAHIQVTVGQGQQNYRYQVSYNGAAYVLPLLAFTPVNGNVLDYYVPVANPGTYRFRITDASGCTVETDVITVTPRLTPAITLVAQTADILCPGGNTAAIAVTVNNATLTGTYTLSVINTTTGEIFNENTTELTPGDYDITITDDATQCVSAISNITIDDVLPMTFDVDKVDIQCTASGYEDGKIIIGDPLTPAVPAITNGVAPYTYIVSNNNTSEVSEYIATTGEPYAFDIINYGVYTLEIIDDNGCSVFENNINIASPPNNLTITTLGVADCSGADVMVKVAALVPGTDYMFAIMEQNNEPFVDNVLTDYIGPDTPGGDEATFYGLIPGMIYTFVVWDRDTNCYYLKEAPAPLPASSTVTATPIVATNVTCKGEEDGNVSFTITGYHSSTTDVLYEIYTFPSNMPVGISDTVDVTGGTSTPVTGLNLPMGVDGLAPGTYIIVFTELGGIPAVNGCRQASASFNITQAATLLEVSAVVTRKDDCNLDAGIITATAKFGKAPYQYQLVADGDPAPTAGTGVWQNSGILHAEAGDYIVYAKDANGCIQPTPAVIPLGAFVDPVITAVPTAQCNVLQGSFSITVDRIAGDATPFRYSLDGGAFLPQAAATFTYTNLTSGTHTVQIKDANGCTMLAPISVTIYPPIAVSANPTTHPSCALTDGVITAAGLGGSGSANYMYELRNAAGTLALGPQQASPVFTGLTAGTYTIRLYDNAPAPTPVCTVDAIVTLIPAAPVTFTAVKDDVNCFGGNDGSITITLGAGNTDAPYTYTIDGLLSAPKVQSDPLFTGLVADTYYVTVTSAKNCSFTLAAPLVVGQPATLTLSAMATPFACAPDNSVNTSTVTLTATGGIGSNLYSINGVNYTTSNIFQVVNTGVAQNLTAYVTNANGCEATFPFTINPLPVMTAATAILTSAIECDDDQGTITVTVTGGSGNYTYQMMPSGTPVAPGVGIYTRNFTITEPGVYTFRITDNVTGCTRTVTAAEVFEYDVIDVIATASTPVTCFGDDDGTLTIDIQNYTGPYNYAVYDGATLVANGSHDTTTSDPFTITDVTAGNLFVSVTATGTPFCSDDSNIITVGSPASPLTLTLDDIASVTCTNNKGEIFAEATGGWGTYVYELNNLSTGLPVQAYGPNNTFTNLPAGNYQVNVRDAGNCVATQTILLSIPPSISADIDATATLVSCYGDQTVTISADNVLGGQLTYEYVLNTYDATGATIVSSTGAQTSGTFLNQGAGIYSITLTDNWGCGPFTTPTITITQPDQLIGVLSLSHPISCDTGAEVTISGIGGTPPYQYSTDNVTFSNVATYPVAVGTHTFYVKDNNGCESVMTNSVTINPVPALNLNLTVQNIYCNGGANGSISALAVGGLGNYQYTLLNNASTPIGAPNTTGEFAGLIAGNYYVLVNSGDCEFTSTVINITEPAPFVVTPVKQDILCFELTNGSITINTTGGSGDVQYAISPNLNQFVDTNVFSPLDAGTYQVIAQDKNGCFEIHDVTITKPTEILATIVNFSDEACLGAGDGIINVTISGGTGSYEISTDDITYVPVTGSTHQLTGLPSGITTVYVKDTNGCSLNPPMDQPILPGVDMNPQVSVATTCVANAPNNDVTITIETGVDPANVMYSINGLPYQASNVFTNVNLAAGTYTASARHIVPVTNLTCIQTAPFTIDPHTAIAATATVSQTIDCFGDMGEITINVTANTGTTPFEYAVGPAFVFGTSNVFDNLPAGTYNFKVRDDINCEFDITNVILGQPTAALLATATTVVDEICLGANDGTITITPTDGTSPYEVRINGGAYTAPSAAPAVFAGLAPDDYTVDVRDANGCTYTLPAAITIAPGVDLQASIADTQVCEVSTIVVSVNPAVAGDVTYYLDGVAQASATIVASNLTPGVHTIDVTHTNTCNATFTFTVAPVIPIVMGATSNTPALCFGEATGTATVTATGGTAPLTYAISADVTPRVYGAYQPTGIFTGLATGDYVINVKDALGCESESTIISIGQPAAALLATATTVVDEICLGANDGTITITPTDGTSPYEVRINGGAYTAPSALPAVFAGLAPDDYTVDVRDANGCTYTLPAAITIAPGVDFQDSAEVLPTCNNNVIGNIVFINVGVAVFADVTYSFDGSAFGPDNFVQDFAPGLHTYEVQHTNGCIKAGTFTVPTLLPISASVTATTDVNCFGDTTGSITVTATDGTGTLSYAIADTNVIPLAFGPYQPTGVFNGLPAGDYTISIMDDNIGCETQVTTTLAQPTAALLATATTVVDEICLGANDGTITITPTDGTSPYEVRINGGAYTAPSALPAVFAGLAPDDYTVDVRDANGCTYTLPAAITIAPGVDLQASIADTQVCEVSTIVVSVNPAVAGDVTYYLDGVAQASATIVASNLTPGVHTIDVTHTNTCNATFTFTVAPVIPIVMGATSNTPALCFGEATGTATVTATGGTAPLTYAISADVTPRVYGAYQPTGIFTGLTTGDYVINVKDALGCESESTIISIGQPAAALLATATTVVDEICLGANDGTITITPTDGTSPYEVRINGGAYTTPSALPAVFAGLTPDDYTVDVRDANGCTYTLPAAITIAPGVDLQASIADTQVCEVSTIVVSVNPAVAGDVTYYLDGVAQASATIVASNLTPGVHTIDVTHTNTCNATFTFTVAPVIPIVMTGVTTTFTPVLCFGDGSGTATINGVTGGTAPLTYAISPNVTPAVYGPYQASNTFTGLTAGSYIINVKDALGCENATTVVTITGPTAALTAAAPVYTDEICFGANDGTMTVTPTAGTGTAPYEVSIDGGTTYTAPGAGPFTFIDLVADTYTVVVRDANGCTYTVPADVTIAPGVDIQGDVDVTQVCEEATIVVNVNPAVAGDVTYSLDGGTPQASNTFVATLDPTVPHTVTILHTNTCEQIVNFNITPTIPINLTAADVVVTDVACHGKDVGSIVVNATGGTGPLQYAITWSIWPNPIYGPSNTFTDLLANEAEGYTLWVKDAMGCFETITVTLDQPDEELILAAAVAQHETCINAHDGSISITVTGGTAPYSTAISSPVNFQQDVFTYGNLYGGTYDVFVRDARGCYDKVTVVIEKGVNLIPGINTVLSCSNNLPVNTVTATLNTIINNVEYRLETAAGVLIQDFDPNKTWDLAAGDYKYIVRHANGCEKEFTFTVQPRVNVSIDVVTPTPANCNGGSDGTLTVVATGGTGALTYGISPDFVMTTNPVFTDLPAGNYTIRVEDAYGCFAEVSDPIVDEPTAIDVTLVGVIEEECIDDNNGEIQILIAGGTGPYASSLNATGPFVADQDTFTNLDGGVTYTIYVQDANGCIQEFDVPLASPMDINATADVAYDCEENTIIIVANSTVNPVELNYTIVAGPKGASPSQVSNEFNNLEDGNYTVEVINTVTGCSDTVDFTVQNAPGVALSLSTSGLNQITATVTGGVGPYYYTFDGTDVGTKNVFTYFRTGTYEVMVTDSRGCQQTASISVKFIDIILPDVTTPDGDGQNDTWSPGNTTNYPNINSDIFDRYGRKLATLRQGEVWDGTYEGTAMPTGDYWYLVKLGDEEDRSFVGHFTIYR